MAEDKGLFSTDLISPEVAAALPETYTVRALRRADYNAGFLQCLQVLTTVGDISQEQFDERYNWMASQDGYYVLVIEDSSSGKPVIVGTGALIVERKLYVDQSLFTLHPSSPSSAVQSQSTDMSVC